MNNWTVGEAKQWLRNRIEEGAKCPCCTQFAKVYDRKIHFNMAKALIIFYRHASMKGLDDYHNLNDVYANEKESVSQLRGDFPKLKHWGLITEQANEDAKKKASGCWKLTQIGIDFIENKMKVHSHVRIYNDRVLKTFGEYVDIRECLAEKYDYAELVSNRFEGMESDNPTNHQQELF